MAGRPRLLRRFTCQPAVDTWVGIVGKSVVIIGGFGSSVPSSEQPINLVGLSVAPSSPRPSARGGMACALADPGRVVLHGGFGAAGNLGDTWVLERGWERLPSSGAPSPRAGHTLTAMARCLVLFGGYGDDGGLADVHTLTDGTWERLAGLMGEAPAPRCAHSATALDGHRVLIFGGYGAEGALGDAHVLDLQQRTWTRVTAPASARSGHVVVVGLAGELLVVGGLGADGGPADDTDLPGADRYNHGAVVLQSGQLLVSGGASVHTHDPLLHGEIWDYHVGY